MDYCCCGYLKVLKGTRFGSYSLNKRPSTDVCDDVAKTCTILQMQIAPEYTKDW